MTAKSHLLLLRFGLSGLALESIVGIVLAACSIDFDWRHRSDGGASWRSKYPGHDPAGIDFNPLHLLLALTIISTLVAIESIVFTVLYWPTGLTKIPRFTRTLVLGVLCSLYFICVVSQSLQFSAAKDYAKDPLEIAILIIAVLLVGSSGLSTGLTWFIVPGRVFKKQQNQPSDKEPQSNVSGEDVLVDCGRTPSL